MISSLTWLAVKSWLKKSWAFIKKNWQLFVGMLIPIVLYLVTRKGPDLSSVLKRVNDDYQKEIDLINNAHENEINKRDSLQEKYFQTIDEIDKKYEEENRKLSDKERSEIKKLIEDHEDNPEELTRRISELTGFKFTVQ